MDRARGRYHNLVSLSDSLPASERSPELKHAIEINWKLYYSLRCMYSDANTKIEDRVRQFERDYLCKCLVDSAILVYRIY